MSDFRRLLRLFRPHRSAALAAVLAMLGVAVFTGLVTYLFGPLFDQVLTPEARTAVMAHSGAAPGLGSVVGEKSVVRRTAVAKALDAGLASLEAALGVTEKTRAFVLPLLLLAAFVLKNLCAFVAEYRFNAVGLAFVRDLRKTLYERLLGQSGAFFARHPSGDLIARVTGDVDRVQSLFGTDLADLVQSLATLAVLLVVVVSLSPQLTLVALLITPAIVVPVVVIATRLRALSRSARDRMGDLTGVLSETIRGRPRRPGVRGRERGRAGRFSEVNERTFRLARKGARVMAFSSPLVETASVLAFLLLLGYATARITAGKMTLGTFISYGVGPRDDVSALQARDADESRAPAGARFGAPSLRGARRPERRRRPARCAAGFRLFAARSSSSASRSRTADGEAVLDGRGPRPAPRAR